ncbi:MAG TPA: cupin domain-containing protein [Nitrososphaerales archaeon]|nr:cupin domain-containing protein [Nitrososphaerales archaeon]
MGLFIKRLEKSETVVSRSESAQVHAGYVVLGPGREVGEHSTEGEEELIVVVEGNGEVFTEGRAQKIEAPCVVVVPAHTAHNIKNTSGAAALKYVYALPTK